MAGKDIPDNIANLIHVASVLGSFGYVFSHNRTHAIEFMKHNGECVYLKTTNKLSIVLDPRIASAGKPLGGIVGYESWNSNFSEFPTADRSGKKPEKFGIAFDLATPTNTVEVMNGREML